MKSMVRLYPRVWRERYGEEFADILARQRPSLGLMLDVLGGAVDAHLHPLSHLQCSDTPQGDTMADAMMKRSAAGGPVLSAREQLAGGVWMLLATLILTTVYLVLTKFYHHIPAVEGLGYTLLPAMLLFYVQMAYWRRSAGAQVLLVGSGLACLYGVMWGACVVAAAIEPATRHMR